MLDMFSLKEKVAIVTGSARGIGQAYAIALAEAGASLVLVDILEDNLKDTAAKIKEATGTEVKLYGIDVTDSEKIQTMVDEVETTFGKIDILVNNAGINAPKPFREVTEEDWKKIIGVNLNSQFLMSKAVVEKMIPRNYGKIINMASVGGFMALSDTAPYNASKGGVLQLTKTMAADLSEYNLNINAICPGFIDTGLLKSSKARDERLEKVLNNTPLNRLGSPKDLIGACVFLASDASGYMTGTQIVVDGGMSAVAM
ncbi:SDR family NAD(P)-dependent oxidoreductase [Virgibacillus halodenitrificans]|uniref:SDR family NAD(P)-dependent oxidoreductase n=1 Tax=Virgibacillus halodenitrificans TaxID=1482 RepID=UPI001FB28408|nr:glucose 1-dehydrogenase [Virgibacillus halodenitrificans]MCJ0930631.1 glucose 1-dehydrogenase [Virgibacillus halodenitrificans]MEC2160789.1 glucose 1-dehydrogenase [Virgibacillus halodenitrificans]